MYSEINGGIEQGSRNMKAREMQEKCKGRCSGAMDRMTGMEVVPTTCHEKSCNDAINVK